ncbi:hypothetical protein GQX73_g9776 [Xylaria multiplex]|uniref:Glycolipid 2-alpha-mannosyltransferase n=1 Tax=Xylaria multiplex TaxID=323545 RepID=A0A7C8N0V6_9PEZI|nr:hypothetical protein GQX73_g9776 [Xylaria multiplex]
MLLRRFNRALRRVPFFVLVTAAPFILEVLIHQWRYQVPRPVADLDPPFFTSCQEPDVAGERENAVFVMLARNHERLRAKKTIESIEAHFNKWFEYPIMFLNNEPWDPRFVTELNETAGGKGLFEVIPKEQWTFPDWLDQDSAKQDIKEQGMAGTVHAGKEGYHHMCRFYSGWPSTKKVYGYTIALWEVGKTCPSLFHATTDWKESRGVPSSSLWNAMMEASWAPFPFRRFLSWIPHRDAYGDAWSLCHFWSNFEIADMDFFRSRAYQDYFDYLDRKGGFYKERWGDAAVHSLAIGMLADPQQVHHFEDIGYRHADFYQCPANAPSGQLPRSSSLAKNKPWSPEIAGGIGCRCKCKGEEGRNYQTYCQDKLRQPTTPKRGWFS